MNSNKYNFVPILFVLLIFISIGYIVYNNFFDKSTDEILTFNNSSIDINEGYEFDLTKEITQQDANLEGVQWISNNEEVAVVNEKGILTLLSNGIVEIILKNKIGIESSIFVNVNVTNIGGKKLSLSEKSITSNVGSKRVITTNTNPGNIVWKSSNPNVVDISETGVITLKKEGTATVIATNENGESAECIVVVTDEKKEIPVSSVKISEQNIKLNVGSSKQLKVSISPENATNQVVTWTSSNPNVVSVSKTGLITAVGVGNATITIKSNNGKEDKTVVSVIQEVNEIKVEPEKVSLKIGWIKQLYTTIKPKDATNRVLTWTSSNPQVVTVDNNGLVTAKREGSATIIVRTSNGKVSESQIVVSKSEVEVNKVLINSVDFSLNVGNSKKLSIITEPSNATVKTVTWTSSNQNIAAVDSNGLVTAKREGTATITATTSNGKTAIVNVTVNKYVNVENIVINQGNFSLLVGFQKQLNVTVTPNDATEKTVAWSSSNSNVATVLNSGVVIGINVGTTTITATTSNGKTAKIVVTIEPNEIPVNSISLDTSNFKINVGNTKKINATISPTNATNKAIKWSSSNTSIATVSNSGVVTGIKVGTATITATSNNGKTASVKITVENPNIEAESISLNVNEISLDIGKTYQLTSKIEPSNTTNKTVTWSSSNTSIATVSNTGIVTAINAGYATITVKTNNGKTNSAIITVIPKNVIYNESSSSLKFTVEKEKKYYATRIWISDPYNQIKKAVTSGWTKNGGKYLESIPTIMNREINEKNLKSKLVVISNASAWHEPGLDGNSKYNYTSWSPLVITNGEIIRNNYSDTEYRTHTIYGIDASGNLLAYKDSKNNTTEEKKVLYQKIIDAGVKNTFAFSGKIVNNYSVSTSDKSENAKRQVFCQVDKNNFIIISVVDEVTVYDAANIAKELGCKTAVNMDGGSSTRTMIKKRATTELINITGGTRKRADVLYITEK